MSFPGLWIGIIVQTLYVCGIFDLKMLLNRTIILFFKGFEVCLIIELWILSYPGVFPLKLFKAAEN